jgi:hypothetical protein
MHLLFADVYNEDEVADCLTGIRDVITKCVDMAPQHTAFIAPRCVAAKP